MKQGETIDMTPTWEGLLPALLQLIKQGDKAVEGELKKMARAADKWNAYTKDLSDAAAKDDGRLA